MVPTETPKRPSSFRKFTNILVRTGTRLSYRFSHLWEARSLAASGDPTRSRKAYEEFFDLWKDADIDLPIFVEAKKEFKGLK